MGQKLGEGHACTYFDVIILNLRAVAALGTAGPGTETIFGGNQEYSSSYSSLRFLCIAVVPCVFLFKPRMQGRYRRLAMY